MDTLLAVTADRADADALGAKASAVSWPAIIAGAVVAVASALVLIALGTGLGLATVSPWPHRGASPTTFTVVAAIWLVVVQWVASAAGGYLTGRLRVRWVGTHTHEVFFRDTANGFISWALATLIGATVMAVATFSMAGGTARTVLAGTEAEGATSAAEASPTAPIVPYQVDRLFRSPNGQSNAAANDARAETALIFEADFTTGSVAPADAAYIAQLVSSTTGISQADAQARVNQAIADLQAAANKVRAAADAARKAAAAAAIYTALSMLIGAFIACIAAALGGRRRDEHV
ncbi:MAG TPA: hypothetical protein VME21_00585 [Steroidobacteraceae bacterium]|nr:hypothetical protein [Steroidobacteraceae bacterium]